MLAWAAFEMSLDELLGISAFRGRTMAQGRREAIDDLAIPLEVAPRTSLLEPAPPRAQINSLAPPPLTTSLPSVPRMTSLPAVPVVVGSG